MEPLLLQDRKQRGSWRSGCDDPLNSPGNCSFPRALANSGAKSVLFCEELKSFLPLRPAYHAKVHTEDI